MYEGDSSIDTVIVENYIWLELDMPEPLESWSVDDFADVIHSVE